MSIRHPRGKQTFQRTMTIELSGHKGYGAELEVEIEFTRMPHVPARIFGDPSQCHPAEGGEVEIVEIRPFREMPVPGFPARTEFLDAPQCLLDLIEQCIDPSELTGESDD